MEHMSIMHISLVQDIFHSGYFEMCNILPKGFQAIPVQDK